MLLLLSLPVLAQPLRVYSEFARIDTKGEVLAPERPREILSPALARNAFTTLQIAVRVEGEKRYFLYVHQNPEDALHIAVYREEDGRLNPILLPYYGAGSQVFWMDIWADRRTLVTRPVVEPQLRLDEADDNWYVYPMEMRVADSTAPDGPWPEGSATPIATMKNFACGDRLQASPPAPHTLAALHFRNAQQDLALAAHASLEHLRQLAGCNDASPPEDPEAYLHIRDYLLRLPAAEPR
ncbi:MAG TPA: hypothetical protein VEV17_24795 [Bryobacteraceae bacterium]|nr:hypothetical protein [Bryobacteraceae bacterium]